MAARSQVERPVARLLEWSALLSFGVLTGCVVFEAAAWSPVLWPLISMLCIGLAVGALRSTRARPFFVTAFVLSAAALVYVVMLWVVLGGFG